MKKNDRVIVVDRESPWCGKTGTVVDDRPAYFMVAFTSDLGVHERYMTPQQVELAVNPLCIERGWHVAEMADHCARCSTYFVTRQR